MFIVNNSDKLEYREIYINENLAEIIKVTLLHSGHHRCRSKSRKHTISMPPTITAHLTPMVAPRASNCSEIWAEQGFQQVITSMHNCEPMELVFSSNHLCLQNVWITMLNIFTNLHAWNYHYLTLRIICKWCYKRKKYGRFHLDVKNYNKV